MLPGAACSAMTNSYTVSIHYDRRLYRHDIAGSMAHARMLARQGIIGEEDARAYCGRARFHPRRDRGWAFPVAG